MGTSGPTGDVASKTSRSGGIGGPEAQLFPCTARRQNVPISKFTAWAHRRLLSDRPSRARGATNRSDPLRLDRREPRGPEPGYLFVSSDRGPVPSPSRTLGRRDLTPAEGPSHATDGGPPKASTEPVETPGEAMIARTSTGIFAWSNRTPMGQIRIVRANAVSTSSFGARVWMRKTP